MKDFTKKDFDIVERFVCQNTVFHFKVKTLYDQFILGNNMYIIIDDFDAGCKI